MTQPKTRAFTLIELLIVITIIALMATMIVSVVASLKEKARELQTKARMEAVLNGLSTYAVSEGSVAVSLQNMLAWQNITVGVPAFATCRVIHESAAAGSQDPPPFISWTNTGNSNATGAWTMRTLTYAFAVGGGANAGERSLYRRLTDAVVDVQPPAGKVMSTSDFTNAWPTQWPETDWYGTPVGTNAPVLRFPWGKPGLRVDGGLCDPKVAVGPMAQMISEQMTSAGYNTQDATPSPIAQPEFLANSWATLGTSQPGAKLQWNSANSAQTDWVTPTSGTRSDNSPVPAANLAANLPLPFDMGYLSPLATIPLLQAAGIVPLGPTGADEYRQNRKLAKQWNDAWGRPLVVTFAFYQPERYQRNFDNQNRRDAFLRAAINAYQYNRSFYFAVGAAGFTLDTGIPETWTSADDGTTLQQYWFQIRRVAKAADWTESSFAAPPWTGVRVMKGGGEKCLLTHPIEVK